MITASNQDEEPIGSPKSHHIKHPNHHQSRTAEALENGTDPNVVTRVKLPRSSRLNKANGKYEVQQVKLRTRQLTFSLFMFVGAISSLAPFLTLHLTNRVGFLLFESDLLQLRSCLITNIVCFSTLVILGLMIVLISRTLRMFQDGTSGVNHQSTTNDANQQSLINRHRAKRRNLLMQKLLKRSAGSLAIISILAYLSLALIVPHIHQTQRLPYATFDCNANLIIIENCQQQFATHLKSSHQTISHGFSTTTNAALHDSTNDQHNSGTLIDILKQLIGGDLNGNNGRLASKLECLKYNENSIGRNRVPTRFLLNKCGLVCEPQRQQLHQFGDDLNSDLSASLLSPHHHQRPLVAPYSQADFVPTNGTQEEEFVVQNEANNNNNNNDGPGDLMSLKLCFSGEINGANSNYKRFCIDNLTSGDRSSSLAGSSSYYGSSGSSQSHKINHQPQFHPDQTLTVGQLNSILSRVRIDQTLDSVVVSPTVPTNSKQQTLLHSSQPTATIQSEISSSTLTTTTDSVQRPLSSRIDQSTHYVNPIVQFESHFKNWPHLTRASITTNEQQSTYFNERPFEMGETNDSQQQAWCKFKPIPPFIVNNKPFSDIHCSLEHDYLMTTGPQVQTAAAHDNQLRYRLSRRRRRRRGQPGGGAAPKIYFKKSTVSQLSGDTSSSIDHHNERCNIQCKVNILYQTLARVSGESGSASKRRGFPSASSPIDSFYLPMKHCLIVSGGDDDKARASNYYLVFRSIADASLLLAFILIDLQLLIESKDTKQFQLGDKRVRLLGLLLAITLPPLIVGVLFDLAASWMPNFSQPTTTHSARNYRDGYLIQWLNERLIPSMSDILERIAHQLGLVSGGGNSGRSNSGGRMSGANLNSSAYSASNQLPFVASGSVGGATRQRQELVVDNYLIPFIIYAVLMFAFAVSTFKLPLVSLASPLVAMSSTEELGMVETINTPNSSNSLPPTRTNTNGRSSKAPLAKVDDCNKSKKHKQQQQDKVKDALADRITTWRRSLTLKTADQLKSTLIQSDRARSPRKLVTFALLTLFMGLQFNLSQITQTQILLESFNIHNNLMQQQQQQQPLTQSTNQLHERPSKVAIWFVLVSNSSGALILVLAILFGNELALFLNEFYPFKTLPKIESQLSRRQNRAQFYMFLAISLVIYALRYFVLANMAAQAAKMKWFLVVLFQSTELLNFPLTWFVLTLRAHELLLEYDQQKQQEQLEQLQDTTGNKTNGTGYKHSSSFTGLISARSLSVHLVIQSVLAFVYFALARFLALFVHSFHASLYLHSDDIDWFIESFYDRRTEADQLLTTNNNRTMNSKTTSGGAGSSSSTVPPESLFLPFPSERQTYLHSSRSFVKYNSLVCLIFGLILSGVFLFLKYQIYLEQRRQDRALKRSRASQQLEFDSELIDERLGEDLAKIHASRSKETQPGGGQASKFDAGPDLTQHIPRTNRDQLRRHEQQMEMAEAGGGDSERMSSRAKVHFRYGFGQARSSSSTSSSAGSYSLDASQPKSTITGGTERDVEAWRRLPQAGRQFRLSRVQDIPVIIEEGQQQQQQREKQEAEAREGRRILKEEQALEEEVEQITLTRSKSIQMVADDEDWSIDGELHQHEEPGAATKTTDPSPSVQHRRNLSPEETQTMLESSLAMVSPPPAEFADGFEQMMPPPVGFAGGSSSSREDVRLEETLRQHQNGAANHQMAVTISQSPQMTAHQQRKRQITFAPLTTFIDQDGGHSTEHHHENAFATRRTGQRSSGDDHRFGAHSTEHSKHHKRQRNVVSDERRHSQTRLMASPEPSIDDEEDRGDDDDE